MNLLEEKLKKAENVVILGHVHPDGDCAGSCLALYNYLMENYPDHSVDIYLESLPAKFNYLKNFDKISSDPSTGRQYDLCVCLDSSDRERLGDLGVYLDTAADSFCVDHHITNVGYTRDYEILSDASSTCEVLFGLLEEEKISKEVAECIYTGIIHDTGVFKHSNTSARTMTVAGKMMAKGIDFSSIIDDSFYRKTYVQNQILGRALLESITFLEGKCIFSVVRAKDMEFYGVTSKDMDGIIDQLRITEGIECAIFMYETGCQEFKVSMRSNSIVDVSRIASYFGGGGHVKAAGCTMSGSIYDVINNLSSHIEKQLKAQE
ncbi:bifunctional oligoribonuclease/PAP phosphatase NrnA [Clostridium sp. MCC353]|uniref:DHH family phosphoesterase n=1 Tax=Clostridium sp. MCC353 TaxID=2592646 RepID=UPI001C027687|nr:bifunctional oligoribonuclease/PAP phosphatase NrnA [Clostridium sp. MCC353]MBT9779057.1 bifunctional oligoribonuclease/PAP phosphatase NrnA [Clostridium sp. MCC353]